MPSRPSRSTLAPPPEPDLAAAERLVLELLAIPGKSGEEGRVAAFVAQRLRAAGVPDEQIVFDDAHERTPLRGDTGNLIVKLLAKSPGRRPGSALDVAQALREIERELAAASS